MQVCFPTKHGCNCREIERERERENRNSKARNQGFKLFVTGPDPSEADALFCAGHCHERGIHGFKVDLAAAQTM